MGMRACYMEISEEKLQKLLDSDDLLEDIEALSEEEDNNEIDIDKMWDALHFLLTGVSAIEPIEDDPHSEFIVGEIAIGEEDFIAYTTPRRVKEIAGIVNEINFDDYLEKFDMQKCKEADLYPDIWDYDDEKEEIMEELSDYFETLKKFYRAVAEHGNAVLVSIC